MPKGAAPAAKVRKFRRNELHRLAGYPPGFTITTEVCTYYYANKRTYPKVLDAQAKVGIATLEKIMGVKFGAKDAMPLLVSVRSGARDSMQGMMDTILNLCMNDQTVLALAAATKNERFAWDCYRRFIQRYGDVVRWACRSAPVKIMSRSKCRFTR